MKHKAFLLLPLAGLLAACGPVATSTSGSDSDVTLPAESVVRLLTPTGAPALAFYDQGESENWTTGTAAEIKPQFATANYDALVIDSITGLNVIDAQEEPNYVLASFLTGGNFHLVSAKHEDASAITADSKILSFNYNSLPDQVFRRLAKEAWGWDFDLVQGGNIFYVTENNVSAVASQLIADPEAYDYYFIAEPALTNAETKLKSEKDVTLNRIYDLRAEWEEYSGQSAIPQAALFMRSEFVEKDQNATLNFLSMVETNLDDAVNNPSKVKTIMDGYGDANAQATRFGFNSNLVQKLQSDGQNRFGMVLKEDIADNRTFVNDFYSYLTGTAGTYGEELFL